MPHWPLIRVGRVSYRGGWEGHNFQLLFFLSPVSTGKEGKGTALCCQTIFALEDGRWSFDDALETMMWGRTF